MTRTILRNFLILPAVAVTAVGLSVWSQVRHTPLEASSHREAPLIADDPLADNTDVYAFRAPNDANRVVLIANYVPFELPHGGPNYYNFGENIRYEVHVKNDGATAGDDITYRFLFTRTNEDGTTFFNIRNAGAGAKQNLKTTYTCQKSVGGGSFVTIVNNGVVPPNNIGARSIEGPVGLGAPNYESLRTSAITNATGGGGETIYCGPADDPFFADLGAIFDLAGLRPANAEDGLAKKNVHTIALSIPIATLQKDGQSVAAAVDILDPAYVIGVWASASRQLIRTLDGNGGENYNGSWVQVSRLGMPLTNEVVNPLGAKDRWNSRTPYDEDLVTDDYLSNPELALYMDTRQFGGAVPALAALDIQSSSLNGFPGIPAGGFDFGNTHDGLFPLKSNPALNGTALADAAFGNYLLRDNKPRSVDILPIFHTGVPNLIPYQLATGKPTGNPLAVGKPFVNNFLPLTAPGRTNPGGDMLRLNMAVPATSRTSPDFSNDGLLAAAVLGLTDSRFNQNATLQAIPNMDGFPNGRRLEDEVAKIELKAVGGAVLAAVGLWYDDYTPASPSVLTAKLGGVLSFTTGLEVNDTTMRSTFPYVQTPWRGTGAAGGAADMLSESNLTVSSPMNVPAGNYNNITVTSTGIATLTGPVRVRGTLVVSPGGELITACQPITGPGKVVVAALGTLHVCDAAGLSAAGNTVAGTLRTTGIRTISGDAAVIYDGTVAQVTGPGLPAQIGTLGLKNSSGLTLTQKVSIRQVLQLSEGTMNTNGQVLTLLSSARGTAMVVNAGGTLSGPATAQRFISPDSNPLVGYRHLSSPTTASAVSDLTTSNYSPKVNAAYNALPAPVLMPGDFPNIFGFDETRGGPAADFLTGYFSPAALTDVLTPGRGYSVYMKGGSRPDFVGTFTQTNVTIPGLTRTGVINSNEDKPGWHLLGNPFPSPLDWDNVPVPTGLSSSISVFQSTGSNSGIYLTRANGMGSLPNGLLALGQGFFSRVTGAGPVSLTLPSSARPTAYPFTQPTLFRGAADTRPMVSLQLHQPGTPVQVTDETVIYFQAGASPGLDDRFDGQKPGRNIGAVPTLVSLVPAGDELAVNGLPEALLTGGTTVPLLLDLPTAGTYEFTLAQWQNLDGTAVVLLDRKLNTRTPVVAGTVYSFRATQAGVDMARFALAFGPAATVTGVASQFTAPALVVWPNPAHAEVRLGGVTPSASVLLLDQTGRVVYRAQADATGSARLDLSTLPKGVYVVRAGAQSRRLVVE